MAVLVFLVLRLQETMHFNILFDERENGIINYINSLCYLKAKNSI